jgi:hypothetical protein
MGIVGYLWVIAIINILWNRSLLWDGYCFVELFCGILTSRKFIATLFHCVFHSFLSFTSTEFHFDLTCHLKYPLFFTLESLQEMSIQMISESFFFVFQTYNL